MKTNSYTKIHVERIILTGFLLLISGGTLFLFWLNNLGEYNISFIDALFTSTSAVCVTGLIVVDTATELGRTSQIVVMTLFQLGGLGIMTAVTAMMLLFRQRIGVRERLIFSAGIGLDTLSGVIRLLVRVLKITLFFEILGTIPLFFVFIKQYPLSEAIFHSLFNSISAFCNAGFSTFSDSLVNYSSTITVPGTIILLIFFGGLGFIPLVNLTEFLRGRDKINHHTFLVLVISFALIIFGTGLIALFEWSKALGNLTPFYRLWNAFFLSITSRTAGFNTLNSMTLSSVSTFIVCILMVIGASPGSTGGGLKTTTFGLLGLSTIDYLKGNNKTVIWNRTVPLVNIVRATSMAVIYLSTLFLSVIILSLFEPFSFREIVFEVTSALGTVGLSMGITSHLTIWGKLILIVLMFWGRIGVITLLYGLMSRKTAPSAINYPDINIPLG